MDPIAITEPAMKACSRAALEHASGLSIGELAKALAPLLTIRASLSGDLVTLSTGTNIGTIRVRELRIDIKPRLASADLVTLIRYAYEGDCVHARSETDPDRDGLDELLCGVLAEELNMIRQRGVSRLYVNRRQTLTALRGRPDFLASFPWNERGMTTLTCRYHELSSDTLDNQLILAALDAAILMDIRPDTRRRLSAHRHAWHALAATRSVSIPDFIQARSNYTRLTEHYRLAHHLGQMIVSRLRPRSLFDARTVVTSGVALNMAVLFELAVHRMLRSKLAPLGYDIRYQQKDSHALLDNDGERYRHIRPDVTIFREGHPIAVVDAKWKDYWESEGDFHRPRERISNADLYQLFFYASRLQAGHHLPAPPPAIIIAPVPSPAELMARSVIGSRFQTVRYTAGTMTTCLSLALIPLSLLMRELQDHQFDATRCPSLDRVTDLITGP